MVSLPHSSLIMFYLNLMVLFKRIQILLFHYFNYSINTITLSTTLLTTLYKSSLVIFNPRNSLEVVIQFKSQNLNKKKKFVTISTEIDRNVFMYEPKSRPHITTEHPTNCPLTTMHIKSPAFMH